MKKRIGLVLAVIVTVLAAAYIGYPAVYPQIPQGRAHHGAGPDFLSFDRQCHTETAGGPGQTLHLCAGPAAADSAAR